MGISHELIKKNFLELAVDSDHVEEDNFEITLGNGFNRLEEGYFSVGIKLNSADLIQIHERLGRIVEAYNSSEQEVIETLAKQEKVATLKSALQDAVTMLQNVSGDGEPSCKWWLDEINRLETILGSV